MGFLSYRTETVTFPEKNNNGEPYFVTLTELTHAQGAKIEGKLAAGVRASNNGGTLEEGAIGAWKLEQVAESVVEWNLTDENDLLLPFNDPKELRKSLGRLPLQVFEKLHEATERLNRAFNNPKEEQEDTARFPDSVEMGTPRKPGQESAPDLERISDEAMVS